MKVTNWSEQSLHQKYSGTTRVYSLSCWKFFVPPLIKPTDLEWNSQLVQTILANVTNTVIDKQKQNKFSTHEWVMWTFNSVNPSNSFSWSGSYLAGQKTLSRFFFFQILMKTSKQIYIDIATKSTLKLWNLPSLKVKRPKWANMLPNKVLQTTIQTSVKFRDFAVFAELFISFHCNKSLSYKLGNFIDLRPSFQPCWRIFANFSQSKVQKSWKGLYSRFSRLFSRITG